MHKNEVDSLLMLLLIDKVESFRNSYQLIKVLSWKFKVIEFNEIANYLIENNFVEREFINQIGNFTITSKGKGYLTGREEWLRTQLNELYPNEVEFLNTIWGRAGV